MPETIQTICLMYEHPYLLLGMKKRGFGSGKWNGFGGKVEAGEEIEEAAKRELWEEAGVEAETLKEVGVISFRTRDNPHCVRVHVFSVISYHGTPVESEEMRPRWFCIDNIPYKEMWPDDKYWLPLFLQGKRFCGWFFFDRNENIIEYELHKL